MNRFTQRQFIFHPITVLVISIVPATIFALLVYVIFDGDFRWFLLYYFAPIGIPFVAFLFDRAEQYALAPIAVWVIDLVVIIPALIRAFVRIPIISGHSLFLTYCILTSQSKVARITAVLVLVQVVYLKLFVTHDTALFGGLIVGCLVALVYRRIKTFKKNTQLEGSL